MFSCKYHIVLGFTFRYLIHSDLIFAYGASTLTSSGCSLEGLMLKLKLQYFGHLMQRADSLEKTLTLPRQGSVIILPISPRGC